MTLDQLKKLKAPFGVRFKGSKRRATITGFTQNDPLGVGGGLFPEMPTAYFKAGGWILVRDLLEEYEIVKIGRGKR